MMFGFGRLVPPLFGLPEVGMQVLGIFLGLIWLWSVAEIIWPSILGVVALGMSDYCSMNDAILNGLGQSTIWQMLMVMMLIGAINESGCGTVIANKLLSIKFTKGRPVLFVWVFLIGFMTMAVFIGMLATVLLSWGVIVNICNRAGYQKGDKFFTLFMIGDFLATNFGTTVLPFKGVKLSLLKAFSNITGNEIEYFTYMAFTYFSGVLTVTLFVLLMRYIFKADFSKIEGIDASQLALGETKFSTEGKIYLGAFAVALAYILISSFVKIDNAFYVWLTSAGSASIFAIIVGILSMVKYNGNPLINFKKLSKHIEWSGIFICASAIQVASALVNESCGVLDLITSTLTPLFSNFTGYIFVVAVVVVSAVLTNVANNIAVGMLMLPLVMGFAQPLGLNINLIGILIAFTVQNAWMLPGASAPAALLHGNENVAVIDIYKYGFAGMIVLIAVLTFIMYPVFNLFM